MPTENYNNEDVANNKYHVAEGYVAEENYSSVERSELNALALLIKKLFIL